jgi:glycosyltransferase involved in cell wall biosynthesis
MPDIPHRRISVVLPTYNRANFLDEALDSILSQITSPDEVIVVNDGSTDDTAAVLKKFSKYIRSAHIRNSGAPVARNVGAYLATGDWLWFCDSDDIWSPSYLARMHELLAEHPASQFAFGNFRLVRDGVWDIQTKFETAPQGFWSERESTKSGGWAITEPLYAKVLEFQPIFHSTLLVSRTLFDSIGGYNPRFAHTGSEDFEFILRCAANAPAAAIGDALVGIRRHAGNFSADQLHNLLGEIEILRYAAARHNATAHIRATINDQIAKRSLQGLELAFSAGNYPLVKSLASSLKGNAIGLKPQIKTLLAAMPAAFRDPIVTLAKRRMQ